MGNPYSVQVEVDAPPRGVATQPYVKFRPAECVCTWSWGLQPARALIDWVSVLEQPAIQPQSALTIKFLGGAENGGHTFHGLCQSLVPVLGSDGISQMQEFVDSREFLMWDVVYGMFNQRIDRIVNGQFRKYYAHILPRDFNTFRETYTDAPYTAREILDFLFNAPTVESPWTRIYHVYLNNPIYGIDCLSGRKLGQVVMEISERLGLTFTLQGGRYQLVWALKGVGMLPPFPANSDVRRGPGWSLSGNPTRVRLLGDRNLYQVLNVDLEPDWLPGWQAFYDFNLFVRDIFLNESTEASFGGIPAGTRYSTIDPEAENNAGYLLARARAQTMTVGAYADLRDARDGNGSWFRDPRKFQNRSRLQMPVMLYLGNVLFKAFRFPASFTLLNVNGDRLGLTSLELAERAIVQVTHDPVTGDMYYERIVPSQPNGYAIVQGYQVAADAFKTLLPEHFNLDHWIDLQAVWQAAPFHVDNSGEGDQFIAFDTPIIKSGNLISTAQAYATLDAGATVEVPAVRVALTFAAEKFSYVAGNGTKDDVENVSGLNGEYVGYSGFQPVELDYADGYTATEKAEQIAVTLLNRQFYYAYGGYVVQGCNGTQLSPMLDRVTVSLNAQGLSEEVDFTSERARNVTINALGTALLQVEPDRDFNRRAQLAPLLPGQAELRESSNQLRAEAALLLKSPRISRTIVDTFHLIMGLDAPPDVVIFPNGAGTVPAGTPVFRESASNVPVQPSAVSPPTLTSPVFMGATVVQGEQADGPVRVTRQGNGGVVLLRVRGPVSVNTSVGLAADKKSRDYLSAGTAAGVGTALEEVAANTIKLIRVRVAGGGGGTAQGHFRGEYLSDGEYGVDDQVVVVSGASAGTYVCVQANPGVANPPWVGGGYWVKHPAGALGSWM